MKTEDISKLPPELRKAAELCAEGKEKYSGADDTWGQRFTCEAIQALPLALTWGLQVVEERDRVEGFLNTERNNHGVSISAWEQLEKDVARAARLMPSEEEPEENAPWMVPAEPEPMGPFELTEAIAAMMEMFDREMRKDEKTIDTLKAKLSTAEATIATLKQEAEDDALVFEHAQEVSGKQEATIATLTRENAELIEQLRKEQRIIGLSHTPEGAGTTDYRRGGK